MKLRLPLIMGITVAALVTATASPAFAAQDGNTAATFALDGGTLDITTAAAATLADGDTTVAAQDIAGQLGSMDVVDGRGEVASWTATVSSTAFVGDVGGSTSTSVSYSPGAATATSGAGGTFTAAADDADITAPGGGNAFAFSATTGGNNTASWNPTLTVHLPAGSLADTYAGTVTTSVS